MLLAAMLLVLAVGAWARYEEEPGYQVTLKKLVLWCSPQGLLLFIAGVVSSGLAFWLNTLSSMHPWGALLAWLLGMLLALAGAWRFGAIQQLRPLPIATEKAAKQPPPAIGSRSIPFSRGRERDEGDVSVASLRASSQDDAQNIPARSKPFDRSGGSRGSSSIAISRRVQEGAQESAQEPPQDAPPRTTDATEGPETKPSSRQPGQRSASSIAISSRKEGGSQRESSIPLSRRREEQSPSFRFTRMDDAGDTGNMGDAGEQDEAVEQDTQAADQQSAAGEKRPAINLTSRKTDAAESTAPSQSDAGWQQKQQTARQTRRAMVEWLMTYREVFFVFALLLLALLLRSWHIGSIPYSMSNDEAQMGLTARNVLAGDIRDPFATGWFSHPNLWFFMQAGSLQLFGDTIGGLRMMSVLLGTLAVAALYVLGRQIASRPVAAMAAALLAVYHVHMHYSRSALNNIADQLPLLVCFAAFVHGFKNRSPFSFLLAGVALGVAQHFYMGARLIPLILLAVLLHQLLVNRSYLASLKGYLFLLLAGFVMGAGPLLRYFLSNPHIFNSRLKTQGLLQSGRFAKMQEEGMSGLEIWLQQAKAAFGGFTFVADRTSHYQPGMPLLDTFAAILFVLGVVLVLLRWQKLESALLIAWIAGTAIAGGMLLYDPPQSTRYLIAAPAICLLVAQGIEYLVNLLRWVLSLPQRSMVSVRAVAVVLLAFWNINFYFNVYTPDNFFGWHSGQKGTRIGHYLAEQPDSSQVYVYFLSDWYLHFDEGPIQFLAPAVAGSDVNEPITSPADLPQLPMGARPVFILLPEREEELAIIRERYPEGELHRVVRVAGERQGVVFAAYEPHER